MWIGCFLVGVLGGIFFGITNPGAGGGWFASCVSLGVLYYLDEITSLLQHQKRCMDWQQKREDYRFEHDHPNAAAITAEREGAKAEKKRKATEDLIAKQAAEKTAKAEAKRRASEPTFVAVEAVPDVPADFQPKKKRSNVDFSAIDEAAKSRRKSP